MNLLDRGNREQGSLGISLLVLIVIAETVALPVMAFRARGNIRSVQEVAAARYDSLLEGREIVGQTMPAVRLPSLPLAGDTVDVQAVAAAGPTAFWIFGVRQCLMCFAEGTDWSAFNRDHADIGVVAIASGRNRDAVEAFWRDEDLEFPVLYDASSSVLRALGAGDSSTVRLFVRGGRVALIEFARKSTTPGLLEQLDLLYSSNHP